MFARLAREAGVERLIHISRIGADPASPSDCICARGEGEIVAYEAFRAPRSSGRQSCLRLGRTSFV
jgi:hypothetical protein